MARDRSDTIGWEDSCRRRCGYRSAAQVIEPIPNTFTGRNQCYHAFKTCSERLDRHAEMDFRSTDDE